jgi:hypothetical protein
MYPASCGAGDQSSLLVMDKPKPVVAVAAMGETAFEEKDDVRLLLQGLPVKHAGMALSDPTKSAESNYEASVLVASHLLAALRGTEAFRSTEHVAVIKAVRSELTSRKKKTNDTARTPFSPNCHATFVGQLSAVR